MICEYCSTANSGTEHRCRRCQRRLGGQVPTFSAHANYPVSRTATARKYEVVEERAPVSVAVARRDTPFEAIPGDRNQGAPSVRMPVQGALFGREALKVVTIDGREDAAPVARKRTQAKRLPLETFDQGVLDFFNAPKPEFRHVGQEVRSAVYCDYQVASVLHRSIATVIDVCLILFSMAVFAAIFAYGGGEFDFGPAENKLIFSSLLVILPLIYKMFWASAGADTPGAQYLGLRLTDFDGRQPVAQERIHRVFASLLSLLAAGIGILWVFLDEETLSWQDHISGTFFTADEFRAA